jgi:hypothetical protein
MTFDECLGKECLIFFANPSRWDGKEAAVVEIIGAEPGGIWVQWDKLAEAFGPEALQEIREAGHGVAFFIPFLEIRLAARPRPALAEDDS